MKGNVIGGWRNSTRLWGRLSLRWDGRNGKGVGRKTRTAQEDVAGMHDAECNGTGRILGMQDVWLPVWEGETGERGVESQ